MTGTYRDVKSGKSVSFCTFAEKPTTEVALYFPLFLDSIVVNPSDTVKYAQTRFEAHLLNTTTMEARLTTGYNVYRSSGSDGAWEGDSSKITLRRY